MTDIEQEAHGFVKAYILADEMTYKDAAAAFSKLSTAAKLLVKEAAHIGQCIKSGTGTMQ